MMRFYVIQAKANRSKRKQNMSEQEYIERMKEEIRGKLKHSLDSPTDFDYLALQVKIVTGEDISSTTL